MTRDEIEARAKVLHRQWARHTIRLPILDELGRRVGAETADQAHERRWATMAQNVRDEFMAEAEAEAAKACPATV